MKKWTVAGLTVILAISASGCGSSKKDSVTEPKTEETAEEFVDDGYIHISTPEEFQKIQEDLGGKYILDENINDWSGGRSTTYSVIGSIDQPFTGELNGNGHTISGTLGFSGTADVMGLFACNEGYIHDLRISGFQSTEMYYRYNEAWETERTYASLAEENLPTEAVQYYSVLCGVNRGKLENIVFTSSSEINIYQNSNKKIYIGGVCAYNNGVISGVTMDGANITFRTYDEDTVADIGIIAGYQTADAVLENISDVNGYVAAGNLGPSLGFLAPALNMGMCIGEAEGRTTVRDIRNVNNFYMDADFLMNDIELCQGGIIGRVLGDIELSSIEINNAEIKCDISYDQEGYIPDASSNVSSGLLVGWADGSVSVSDITLDSCYIQLERARGENQLPAYAGGLVGYCGGDLTAQAVKEDGEYASVHANVTKGDAYAAGLCAYCAGSAQVNDSLFQLDLNSWFSGNTLFEANAIGRVDGDAAFNHVEAYCPVDELTGEPGAHSFPAVTGSTYYLAALAGAAKGSVTAEDCVIEVQYSLFGGGAVTHGAESTNGVYNPY